MIKKLQIIILSFTLQGCFMSGHANHTLQYNIPKPSSLLFSKENLKPIKLNTVNVVSCNINNIKYFCIDEKNFIADVENVKKLRIAYNELALRQQNEINYYKKILNINT